MQTAKQELKRAAPWLFLLLVLAGLAAVRGLAANYEIGYEIMNGDIQNYNRVRHLLAGQVPYRDFTVYLGAGELYSVGGLLLVLGNSFGRSMFATNFCTWFYFELLVLAGCCGSWGFALLARFTYPGVLPVLADSGRMTLANLLPTVGNLAFLAWLPLLANAAPAWFVYLLPLWLLIGGAGSALGMASLMRPAFAQLEKAGRKEEEPEEEPDTEGSVQ